MSPDAKRHVLLYVGDEQTNDVYVYTYPMGKLVGTLTGFDLPLGECSDRAGNVWIADGLASQMVEYAHAGTTATATLDDPGQAPYGCAVDPKSGDLAVANYEPLPSGGPGSISVYAKAKGSPKVYADPNSANEMFVAYDENTLYVVGQTATFAYQLAAFANETFTDLTLSGATISTPGGVGLDNGLWIGDVGNGGSSSANIYQITVSGTTATVTGTTPLTNGDYCADELAHHGVALCTPGEGQYYVDSVLFYKYPAGGSPYKPVGNVDGAYGLAISR
jgi:hypothetical protein